VVLKDKGGGEGGKGRKKKAIRQDGRMDNFLTSKRLKLEPGMIVAHL
jgi:hypothetical protein